MTLRPGIVATCLLCLTVSPAVADKASDAIDRAKNAYAQGDVGKAYIDLQIALTRVGRKLMAVYEKTFPAAPSGWKARNTRSRNRSNVPVQGFVLNRRYHELDGKGRITAQLIVDSPMLNAMAGMFSNPAMAMRMNYEHTDVEGAGQPVWVKFDEDRNRGEAVLVIAGRIFIKLTGRNLEDADILTRMISAWDLTTLKKTVGVN